MCEVFSLFELFISRLILIRNIVFDKTTISFRSIVKIIFIHILPMDVVDISIEVFASFFPIMFQFLSRAVHCPLLGFELLDFLDLKFVFVGEILAFMGWRELCFDFGSAMGFVLPSNFRIEVFNRIVQPPETVVRRVVAHLQECEDRERNAYIQLQAVEDCSVPEEGGIRAQ